MTFLTFDNIEDTLNKVAAVLQIVHFRNHKDVTGLRMFPILRMDIVGDVADTVNGFLVVTTKENIRHLMLDVPISRYPPLA